MKLHKMLAGDAGYTLIESLVSMALVVAVLIPLGVTLGTFALSQEGSHVYQALELAQQDMNRAFFERDFLPEHQSADRIFLVQRSTEQDGDLITIRVSVFLAKKPDKPLVTIQKSMILHP
jgi:type II secretory pathway pseudopilin PulG